MLFGVCVDSNRIILASIVEVESIDVGVVGKDDVNVTARMDLTPVSRVHRYIDFNIDVSIRFSNTRSKHKRRCQTQQSSLCILSRKWH
jgi:hypothetical protein